MADATAAVTTTDEKISPYDMFTEFVMATSATIYQGSGVAIGSDGKLVHASQASATYTVGRAEKTVTSAAAGTVMRVKQGIFRFANSGALTIANRLGPCYWTDDQTVGTDSSKLLAGIVYDVDSQGVWVICGAVVPANAAGGALLAANNLGDVNSASASAHSLGLGTADSPTFSGATLTGALIGTTAALTGNVTHLFPTAVKTTTYSVANATDSGAVLQTLTDGEIFNLPACAAGNKGQKVTFQNTAADGAALIKVEPNGTNKIKGQVGSVEASGASSKGLWNTKATQKQGDHVTLMSDGADVWWIIGGLGVWASET